MHQIPVRYIKEPELSGNLTIRDIQDLLAGKDLVQELHRHNFLFILALEKGSGLHTIDFNPYPINDHTVFFMRPGQVHELLLKGGCTGYILQFNPEVYPFVDLLRQAGQQNHYQLDEYGFRRILKTLTAIFEEQANKQERFQDAIKASLDIFLIELTRQQPVSVNTPQNRYRQERLDKFIALLEQHILTKKHSSQYADLLNLSTYQLNAIAKEFLGKTTSELINEQIVLEAKRCLLATSHQVNQIAYHMGYEDPSYFIRFFKKQTGQSPDVFRHNFR